MSVTDLVKGENSEGIPLVSWDLPFLCTKKSCPIGKRCGYQPKKEGEPCFLHTSYLGYVYNSLAVQRKEELTWELSHKIGLLMIPLYSHLVKFKIFEAGLNGPMVVGSKGSQIVNPIYREIRDTIKTLTSMHKEFGLNDRVVKPEELDPNLLHGDPSYYEQLYDGEEVNGGERELPT